MSPDKEKKLFEDFPKIFPGGRNVDPRENLMCFGFECGDGWFDLIYDMCEHLQHHIDNHYTSKRYKLRLIDRLINTLPRRMHKWKVALRRRVARPFVKMRPAQMIAVQVKEKYGTLRFYTTSEGVYVNENDPTDWIRNDIVTGIKSHAGWRSAKTCEECGAKGHVRGWGWVKCLCNDCAKASDGMYPTDEEEEDDTAPEPV